MIQIDMQMPTNCLDCPVCDEYLMCAIPVNGRKWGENDVRGFGQGKPEWCPLKEQETIVRCKDCKNFSSTNGGFFCKLHFNPKPDWFCADGIKRDGDEE